MAIALLLAALTADEPHPWPASTYGNHRYAITVPTGAEALPAFTATLEWRRSGSNANISSSLVLFIAAAAPRTGSGAIPGFAAAYINASTLKSSRHSATVAIDARPLLPGSVVHAYYMPFERTGSVYGMQVRYLTASDLPFNATTAAWLAEVNSASALPHVPATSVAYEARDSFNAFTELERTATANEIAQMLTLPASRAQGAIFIFPEPRARQIKMLWRSPWQSAPDLPDLPVAWAKSGPSLTLDAGPFARGEYATFQLGIFASSSNLTDLVFVNATQFVRQPFPHPFPLAGPRGHRHKSQEASIPADGLTCFNLEGVDNRGQGFRRKFSVPHLQTGALWFGLPLPTTIAPGRYMGNVTLQLSTGALGHGDHVDDVRTVGVSFTIEETTVRHSGDANLSALTRTRWINSRAGLTNQPPKRFSPLDVDVAAATVRTWSSR